MVFVPPKDRVLEHSTSNSQTVFAVTGALDTSYNAFNASMSVGDTTIGGVVEAGTAFVSGVLTYSNINEVTVSSSFESKGTFSPSGVKEVFMGLPGSRVLMVDGPQSYSANQKSQARANIAVPPRNYLINPSGVFQQAGLASTSNGGYTGFDQWLALTQANPVTPSQVTAAENGTPSMMRLTQANASAQRMGLIQWIENADCADLRGQTVVASARARMSAATTLRFAILEWTGTADAITKDVVNSWTNSTFTAGNFFKSTTLTVTATGSIALAANTLTDVSVTGSISGSANNAAVFFWTDSAQAQNVTMDIGKAQLELGAVATPHIPPQYTLERARCQRFFLRDDSSQNSGRHYAPAFVYNTSVGFAYYPFPVAMRAAPTLSVSAAGHFQMVSAGVTLALSSLTTDNATSSGHTFSMGFSGATSGLAGFLRANATTAGVLTFDARL